MASEVFRTCDLDEAMYAVGRVYCPHTVVPRGPVGNIEAGLEVMHHGGQSLVALRYSTPVKIDAGRFPNLMLIMTAAAGSADAMQGHQSSRWRVGQTLPLSPGLDTVLNFDRDFAQRTLRVDVDRLETLCARWLGHPLDVPLRFALCPFSPSLEAVWQDALRMVNSFGSIYAHMPNAASAALDEFLLSLVLHGHAHNHSAALVRPTEATPPRLVRSAEAMFRERSATGTTVSEVACDLGVSVRSLQLGFREARQTTPSAFLRQVRFDAAHCALSAPTASTSVTDVAVASGFAHTGRFSAAYKARYGEAPATTLRRSRQRS